MHLAGHPSRDKGIINNPENSFGVARHCLHKKLIEGKMFLLERWQELLLEESCSFLFLDKFMHGDQSLRKMVCFVQLFIPAPLPSLNGAVCAQAPQWPHYKQVYFVSGFSFQGEAPKPSKPSSGLDPVKTEFRVFLRAINPPPAPQYQLFAAYGHLW